VIKKALLCLLICGVLLDFTGCAMDAQARRERAYRHYVAKQMKQRQKRIARAQKEANRELKRKTKNLQPSEPRITAGVEQADNTEMPSVFEPVPPPAPVPTDSVAPPVTVSATNEIMMTHPDQPSPP